MRKEALAVLRDPRNRMALIAPPLLQLCLFSFSATLEVKNISLGVWNQDYGQTANEIVQRLEASNNFKEVRFVNSEAELRSMIDNQTVLIAVVFPADFSRRFGDGTEAPMQVIADGRRSNAAQIAQSYVTRIIDQFTTEQATTVQPATLVARSWFNPNLDYIWFTLPSLAVIITLQICLNVTAMSVAREREMGTFDQLLVSPMQPLEIMAGKSIPALIFALTDATVFLLIAMFIFRIPFHGSLPLLYLSLTMFITAMIGIGLSISSIAVTQQQALLGMFTVMMPALLLSGYASPIENMPDWLQPLTYLNPLRYMMVIMKGVYLKNLSASDVLANTWQMALIAVFTLSFATWLFRRRLA
jgi:ABC-2 type transport system permease protein